MNTISLNLIPVLWGVPDVPVLLVSALVTAFVSAVVAALLVRAVGLGDMRGYVGSRGERFLSALTRPGGQIALCVLGLCVFVLAGCFGKAGAPLLFTAARLPFAVALSVNILSGSASTYALRLEEDARVLGAPPWTAFASGALPVLAPGLFTAVCLCFLSALAQDIHPLSFPNAEALPVYAAALLLFPPPLAALALFRLCAFAVSGYGARGAVGRTRVGKENDPE